MKNLEIYCVTNKKLEFLEKTPFKLVGVGKDEFPENYIRCDTKDNIYYKKGNIYIEIFMCNYSKINK